MAFKYYQNGLHKILDIIYSSLAPMISNTFQISFQNIMMGYTQENFPSKREEQKGEMGQQVLGETKSNKANTLNLKLT